MVETCTQNEMIKAMYHELSSEDMVELETQLENNSEFEHSFEDLNVIKLRLNDLIESPGQQTIANILNYSLNYKK